jgi:epoxyqueuosine reductase
MAIALADEITGFLQAKGASLVGFADLSDLPIFARRSLPRAVGFAVALAPEIVAGIKDGPTKEYYAEYERVNAALAELSLSTAALIRIRGFTAISSAPTNEGVDPETHSTSLPQKTVGTLAGFGWIGKCALLVNEQFGSAIRLNRVLTDAPLPTGTPITASRCGDCRACVDACPGHAATGDDWSRDKHRNDFFDASACRHAARENAQQRTGILDTFCGICIAACPWTQAYIKRSAQQGIWQAGSQECDVQ